jgi:hypothetical protein
LPYDIVFVEHDKVLIKLFTWDLWQFWCVSVLYLDQIKFNCVLQNCLLFVCCNLASLVNFYDLWIQHSGLWFKGYNQIDRFFLCYCLNWQNKILLFRFQFCDIPSLQNMPNWYCCSVSYMMQFTLFQIDLYIYHLIWIQ